jgi:hypothetical protein
VREAVYGFLTGVRALRTTALDMIDSTRPFVYHCAEFITG